jgi:chromosome partitioning protein
VRRILIASSKGGCGKTTLATNLAVAFACTGRRVVIVDCDRQQSSLDWFRARGSGGAVVRVLPGGEGGAIASGWSLRVPPDTDVLLVDTPAGLRSVQLAEVLRRCDSVVVPVLPSAIDLRATAGFLAELRAMPEVRQARIRVGLVANRVRERTLAARELAQRASGLDVPLLGTLRDAQAYVLAAALGRTVFDYDTPLSREHAADWVPLLRWIANPAGVPAAAPPLQASIA